MAKENFTVRWSAEDGFVSGDRTHALNISADDLPDTVANLDDFLDEEVNTVFNDKVYPSVKNRDAFIEWATQVIASREE